MAVLHSILCRLGFHDWQEKPFGEQGLFRYCPHCQAKQVLDAKEAEEDAWDQMRGI